MPNLTNFGKLAGMTFQVMQPTKMDFAGVEATQMMHDFKFEPNRSTLRYLDESSKKGVKWSTLSKKKVPILMSFNSKHKFRTKFGPKTLWETGSPMRLCTVKGSFGPLKKCYFTVKMTSNCLQTAFGFSEWAQGPLNDLQVQNKFKT